MNPETGATAGKVNAELQVKGGAVIVGAAGKITTLTVLLKHAGLAVPAGMVSQSAANTYRAWIV